MIVTELVGWDLHYNERMRFGEQAVVKYKAPQDLYDPGPTTCTREEYYQCAQLSSYSPSLTKAK